MPHVIKQSDGTSLEVREVFSDSHWQLMKMNAILLLVNKYWFADQELIAHTGKANKGFRENRLELFAEIGCL